MGTLSSEAGSFDSSMSWSTTETNPATGLPMMNGQGGIDTGGNAFGSGD